MMLEVTEVELEALLQSIEVEYIERFLHSRTKYFAQELNDDLREEMKQRQTTRARMLAVGTSKKQATEVPRHSPYKINRRAQRMIGRGSLRSPRRWQRACNGSSCAKPLLRRLCSSDLVI
jgi:hypothetical protein